jgi:hypothetical protein
VNVLAAGLFARVPKAFLIEMETAIDRVGQLQTADNKKGRRVAPSLSLSAP